MVGGRGNERVRGKYSLNKRGVGVRGSVIKLVIIIVIIILVIIIIIIVLNYYYHYYLITIIFLNIFFILSLFKLLNVVVMYIEYVNIAFVK